MENDDLMKKAAYGALAGAAVVLAVHGARGVGKKMGHLQAGESGVQQRLLPNLPKPVESAGAAALQFAYGSTGSAIYTALRSDTAIAMDGAALGVAIWAAGRLGWLPAAGLTPKGEKPARVAASLAQHLLFGIATVGAYHKLTTPANS
jgi:hypothetical protein